MLKRWLRCWKVRMRLGWHWKYTLVIWNIKSLNVMTYSTWLSSWLWWVELGAMKLKKGQDHSELSLTSSIVRSNKWTLKGDLYRRSREMNKAQTWMHYIIATGLPKKTWTLILGLTPAIKITRMLGKSWQMEWGGQAMKKIKTKMLILMSSRASKTTLWTMQALNMTNSESLDHLIRICSIMISMP